jgi:signal peptidase I
MKTLRALALAVAMAAAAGVLLRRLPSPIGRYIVEGSSMEPAYRAGDRIIVNRLSYRRREPVAGDAVVFRDPERSDHVLLKRIAAVTRDGTGPMRYYVLGDNAASSRDSRMFGDVPREAIIGKAWMRY